MSDCVLDASAMVLALSGKTAAAFALRARLARVRKHAPHLIDAEVGNVLRRHEQEGRLRLEEALLGLRASSALVDYRYPQNGRLAEQAWSLRKNLSFYDALYIALAGLLGISHITAGARLSRAPNLPCQVELI